MNDEAYARVVAEQKLRTLFDQMQAEDFARLHRKFMTLLTILDAKFEQRFPREHADFFNKEYGE